MNDSAAIFQAAKDGNADQLKQLLASDPALVGATDEEGKTPLHWAAEGDQAEVARLLLGAGAEMEAKASWGATAFEWAATMGSTRVADLLLERGARGLDLITAASLGKLDVVRASLDSGAPLPVVPKPSARPDDHWVADSAYMKGDTISHAFYAACRNGHTAVATLLLDRGADVNAKGVFGGAALHWAAINGHGETVAFLVARGADLTTKDARFASTPEGWAAEGGHDEIRQLLRPR